MTTSVSDLCVTVKDRKAQRGGNGDQDRQRERGGERERDRDLGKSRHCSPLGLEQKVRNREEGGPPFRHTHQGEAPQ